MTSSNVVSTAIWGCKACFSLCIYYDPNLNTVLFLSCVKDLLAVKVPALLASIAHGFTEAALTIYRSLRRAFPLGTTFPCVTSPREEDSTERTLFSRLRDKLSRHSGEWVGTDLILCWKVVGTWGLRWNYQNKAFYQHLFKLLLVKNNLSLDTMSISITFIYMLLHVLVCCDLQQTISNP